MIWPGDFIDRVICGDNLGIMKQMPDGKVNVCMTSPPYYGLRNYGVEQTFGGNKDCEHEWGEGMKFTGNIPHHGESSNVMEVQPATKDAKNKQWSSGNYCQKCQAWKGQLGLEPTPELYIEHMTAVFHEVKRALRKDGTLWLNLGDTYSSAGITNNRRKNKQVCDIPRRTKPLPSKCLCMVPERLAWSLIQDGWILRNKNIWYKPNAMPSSVKDRFSNKWEYVFMFSKSQKYYFDLDAVREPHKYDGRIDTKYKGGPKDMQGGAHERWPNDAGKNPGDVFIIPTQPFPEAHFAVFPEKLCEKPIKAGCPDQVCKKCGKARERITEKQDTGLKQKTPDYWDSKLGSHSSIHREGREKGKTGIPVTIEKTIGWTNCGCNAGFDGGMALDPFCGAGTVLYVAKEMGRKYIGIDIKKEFCKMSEKRTAQGVL